MAQPTVIQSLSTTIANGRSTTFLSINPSAVYLGPLTTVFQPPSTCFDIVTRWNEPENVIFHGIQGDPNCYPGDVRVLGQAFVAYYYSPGVCPSGFTEACQDRGQWNAGLPGITASLCCPRYVEGRQYHRGNVYSHKRLVDTPVAPFSAIM